MGSDWEASRLARALEQAAEAYHEDKCDASPAQGPQLPPERPEHPPTARSLPAGLGFG